MIAVWLLALKMLEFSELMRRCNHLTNPNQAQHERGVEMAELSFAEVDALLKYDPETGKLFWKVRTPEMFKDGKQSASHLCARWNSRYAGKEALAADNGHGYLCGSVQGRVYRTHRVIWLIVTGEWPADQIDHINGQKKDNRFANLREADTTENHKNMPLCSRNRSGVVGVHWDEKRQKWQVQIKVDGRHTHLGRFDHLADAVDARKLAEKRYGYHPNHGRKSEDLLDDRRMSA